MSESMSPPRQVRFRTGVNQYLFDLSRGTPLGEYSRGRHTTSDARTGRPPTTLASVRRAGQ